MRASYLPCVVEATYVFDYVLDIRFDNGTRRLVDMSQWFRGPVFDPLKDRAYFKKFFIEGATVVWPNGADISPEALYEAKEAPGRPRKNSRRLAAGS